LNPTIELLLNHRSHRQFDPDYQIPAADRQAILDCARQASTWMNGQFYSIIDVQDRGLREQIVAANNQNNAFLVDASMFLVFVADLSRQTTAAEHDGVELHLADSVEPMLIAAGDAFLAMQNAAVAAESLGLGCVFIGGVRRDGAIDQVAKLLDLPNYVAPICSLAIGRATDSPDVKPRLPQDAVVHVDRYAPTPYETLADYDQTMTDFRSDGGPWTPKFEQYNAFIQPGPKWTDTHLKSKKLSH
jgi:FMN reductase [NAD(P)H]